MLEVSRSVLHGRPPREAQRTGGEELLRARIARLIEQHPTFGYRRIWALLRFRKKLPINRKTVYGVLRRQQWFVHQRRITPRPWVRGWRSQTERSDQRWAMDVTHIPCGGDDWAHLAAVLDCHDREILGFEFALRGRAKEAERALEEACISRFGTLRPQGSTPVMVRQRTHLPEPALPSGGRDRSQGPNYPDQFAPDPGRAGQKRAVSAASLSLPGKRRARRQVCRCDP